MHARIEDGAVVEYPIINLFQRIPSTSLPADLTDDANLPEGFVYVHANVLPTYDQITQSVAPADPEFVGGKWQQTWIVTDLSAEDAAANRERIDTQNKAANKATASQLLSATDYLDLPRNVNKTANRAEIDAYRDLLQAIALNPPVTVDEWPVKPDTVWLFQ